MTRLDPGLPPRAARRRGRRTRRRRGGCGPESDQGRWLARELDRDPAACTLAIWHHPLFTTGEHGPTSSDKPLWDQLHAAGVELVVNGHEHDYERFVPLDPEGRPGPERGIRQIVVGTGGAGLRSFPRDGPNSEVRDDTTHGVLRLDLEEGGYAWTFVPVPGGTFTDGFRYVPLTVVGSATIRP